MAHGVARALLLAGAGPAVLAVEQRRRHGTRDVCTGPLGVYRLAASRSVPGNARKTELVGPGAGGLCGNPALYRAARGRAVLAAHRGRAVDYRRDLVSRRNPASDGIAISAVSALFHD